jgi:glycerol-3-phosphate O-acyltransferase
MDKNSKSDEQNITTEMDRLFCSGSISSRYQSLLRHFYEEVLGALKEANRPLEPFFDVFARFLDLLEKQIHTSYRFEPYHQKVRKPFDYYRFGLNFIRLLIDIPRSSILNLDIATQIENQLQRGENVILFANHQTETDPQAISILLEQTHPDLAKRIIYVAGERVVTDPLAIPFSMGCDLLCIYSKRYIDHPIELKAKKQMHNKHTMERMSRLLTEGGKVIYVAPSGGRDRRNAAGEIEVASFDPQSVEMFYLMARKAKRTTHFYPLTLATYELLPPPETIQLELGEARIAKFTPIHISFSPEFNMEQFAGSEESDKSKRRKNRALAIWKIVNQEHQRLIKL